MSKQPSFVSRNLVAIVMIPSLVGIHLGWSYMQNNRKLVTEAEQIEMPPVTFARFVWNKLTGAGSSAE
ncbi:uncharacterized protein LOC6619257 [Drosophila sechellia]|uniref:GD20058 n=2 Tax=melanogaster subgroup TaxID=32351 RepID=B4QS24_DROSI|nr:uncharacterized protein LOC6619257 [Drosophila sechellia]XP_002102717.1 uncharacterized protein LOC6727332 [Drosophila simulans]EDW49658.1 GM23185 [Drosophila sechellia]EDX12220.1 GD20058 [Drosophila simulans]KMZ02422.1 uncharacterized protein Dsimw501_GD20058 [Drosophila simulans]